MNKNTFAKIAFRSVILCFPILLTACVESTAKEKPEVTASVGRKLQSGKASWYGPGFQGRRTASGERFNTNSLTAAHRSLPFGSQVRVTNRTNGKSVVVRINDRGPFAHGRIIDLSRASALAIGLLGVGAVDVAML